MIMTSILGLLSFLLFSKKWISLVNFWRNISTSGKVHVEAFIWLSYLLFQIICYGSFYPVFSMNFSVFGGRTSREHHRTRARSWTRHHDSGREAWAANKVQTQREPTYEDPSRRPCGEILWPQARTSCQNYSHVRNCRTIHFLPTCRLNSSNENMSTFERLCTKERFFSVNTYFVWE